MMSADSTNARAVVSRAMLSALRRIADARAFARGGEESTETAASPPAAVAAVDETGNCHGSSMNRDDFFFITPAGGPSAAARHHDRAATKAAPRLSFQQLVEGEGNDTALPNSAVGRMSRKDSSTASLYSSSSREGMVSLNANAGPAHTVAVVGEWSLPWAEGGSGDQRPRPVDRHESSSSAARSSSASGDATRSVPPVVLLPVDSISGGALGGRRGHRQHSFTSSSIDSACSADVGALGGRLRVPDLVFSPGSLVMTPTASNFHHHEICHVIPGTLFVGAFRVFCDAETCQSLGIRAYICVAQELVPGRPAHVSEEDVRGGKIGFVKVPLRDTSDASLTDVLPRAIGFIDEQIQLGHPVALYCQAGKSRSVSIALAYLMREYDLSAEDALHSLQQHYPAAEPNIFFFDQLKHLDLRPLHHRQSRLLSDAAPAASLSPNIIDITPHAPQTSPPPLMMTTDNDDGGVTAIHDEAQYTWHDLPMPLAAAPGRRRRRAIDDESADSKSSSADSSRSVSRSGSVSPREGKHSRSPQPHSRGIGRSRGGIARHRNGQRKI